jgi:carbonic anhydrase
VLDGPPGLKIPSELIFSHSRKTEGAPTSDRNEEVTCATPDGARPTAADALARLIAGNKRFVRGETNWIKMPRETLAGLAKGQHPFATVLGCSDSRVPPERVFDAGVGELFVIRVAGNVLSPEVAGSFQYAGSHLNTPLFVVLGHEGCGAVAAAIAAKHHGAEFRSHIEKLLESIVPGLPEFESSLSGAERLAHAVEANVRWTVNQILNSPEGQARLAEGRMRIVGAIYDIQTGHVRWLPEA